MEHEFPALNLIFSPSRVRVGGEVIHGNVDLYFPSVYKDGIEEVYVKLKGTIITKVTRSTGQNVSTDRKKTDIVREEYSIWRKGTNYPPSNSDTLRLHFQFKLPDNSPPSIQTAKRQGWARVQYRVKVVGVRPGMLQSNRRIARVFPVVTADPTGVSNRLALERGWKDHWTTKQLRKEVRKGIWGAHSRAYIEFSLPSLSSLPLFTRIPLTLRVVTHTKPMSPDKEPSYDGEGRLFPSPPIHPTDVQITLLRAVFLRAKHWKVNYTEDAMHVGGCLGSSAQRGTANVEVMETVWEPSNKDGSRGTWKQESILKSFLDLNLPPTFAVEKTLTASYILLVKVIFPGLGNDAEIQFPVAIASAMTPDQQPNRHGQDMAMAPPTYDLGDSGTQRYEQMFPPGV